MLFSQVLVLNKSYIPIHIINARRAFVLFYQGIIHAVDHSFETFDFHRWSTLEVQDHHEWIGLIDRRIRIPRVVLLLHYDRIPRRQLRFSRQNIFLRDGNTCQFCGLHLPAKELNLDHVIPRSRGGRTIWENVVTSCLLCNHRKGRMTPHEAGMKLIKSPSRPHWTPFLDFSRRQIQYDEWKPFMHLIHSSHEKNPS